MPKAWFVTGSSRGPGRSFVEAALERGDRVTAMYSHELAGWAEWEHVSLAAHG